MPKIIPVEHIESIKNKVTELNSNSTDEQYPSAKAVAEALANKQDTLVSGGNIKTINGEKILGSGNIVIGDGLINDYNNVIRDLKFVPSENLLDYSKLEKGKQVTDKGVTQIVSNLSTYRLDVSEGDILTMYRRTVVTNTNVISAQFRYVAAYDGTGNVLSNMGAQNVHSYTVPAGVSYVILSMYTAHAGDNLGMIMCNVDDEVQLTLPFIEYSEPRYVATSDFIKSLFDDTLTESGKIADAKAVGDSINNKINNKSYTDLINFVGSGEGYVLKDNGIIQVNTSFSTSEFLPVGKKFDIIGVYGALSNGYCNIAYYDDAFNFISGENYSNSEPESYNAPENAKWFRVCDRTNTFGQKRVYIGFLYSEITELGLKLKQQSDELKQFVSKSENDGITDIILPSKIDVMENRQYVMYFDNISRFQNSKDLYAIPTPSSKFKRNEECVTYTPSQTDNDFSATFTKSDRITADIIEEKNIQFKVNHKLSFDNPDKRIVKNICICGDSLVDNDHLVTEVYRMLNEDGDCIINQIGTRGPDGGNHEGRGSWTWDAYLNKSEYASKTNAFRDSETGQLNFQKYCINNGYDGIDYFLIALGTNDSGQGNKTINTLEEANIIVEKAKTFINALLSPVTGYPNCKIAIGLPSPGAEHLHVITNNGFMFQKSINTLNAAYLKEFDNNENWPNVTCFSHGVMTNRREAYTYKEVSVSERFPDVKVRQYTDCIHPTQLGYKAWADGYYNKIRGWLTEDSLQN